MSKIYKAERWPTNEEALRRGSTERWSDTAITVLLGSREYPLRVVRQHSNRLEWGYGGAGSLETALSILADYFVERPPATFSAEDQEAYQRALRRGSRRHNDYSSWRYHWVFSEVFVESAPELGLILSSGQIGAWLADPEGFDASVLYLETRKAANPVFDWLLLWSRALRRLEIEPAWWRQMWGQRGNSGSSL